jgi:gluconate 2-dehydrogenase alpha chain
VLATFTWENSRTLLLSKSRPYPNGMSNNHGQVGKYYMRHPSMSLNGLFPGRRLNRFGGTGAQFVGMDDFNGDNFDHTGLGFIQGAQINASMGALPLGTADTTPPSVPRWGPEWKRWLKANANSVGSITAQTEQLPYENNFIDLDPIRRDPQGYPIARTTNLIGANEKAMYAFLGPKLRELLLEAGASETWGATPTDGPGSTHACGGTRMGTDEDSSVVDRWGLSHEVPNLAIMGASLFPTMSGYNPTETIFALTWRTSEYIAKNWKSLTT